MAITGGAPRCTHNGTRSNNVIALAPRECSALNFEGTKSEDAERLDSATFGQWTDHWSRDSNDNAAQSLHFGTWFPFAPIASPPVDEHGMISERLASANGWVFKKNTVRNAIQRPGPVLLADFIPRGSPARAQRHVPHSITTLRLKISAPLLARMLRRPCCGRTNEKRLLCHSSTRQRVDGSAEPFRRDRAKPADEVGHNPVRI